MAFGKEELAGGKLRGVRTRFWKKEKEGELGHESGSATKKQGSTPSRRPMRGTALSRELPREALAGCVEKAAVI